MIDMTGSKVVVTGATGGLGRAVVARLTDIGAEVFAIDRNSPDPQDLASFVHRCDLSHPSDIADVVQAVSLAFPQVDLLVNCAGAFLPDPTLEEVSGALDSLWRNNTSSTVLFTLALEPLLRAAPGASVVNIGSTDGIVASGGQDCEIGVSHDVLYALSKGAVIAFTRALAMKWSKLGIRVNTICPTIFVSPMTESLLTEDKIAELSRHIPLGRLCRIEDVVDAVIFAHQMKFTTGHAFPVDGGYLCQ
jgi:NAD(P)-dependent dehydrogenase (short-subunit alcohol dehydrogenase family)